MPAKKSGRAPSCPRCASPEDVQKYEADQIGGPDKSDILLAWHQPLSSLWNRDAITLLAEKARQLLKAGKTEYDVSWLELQELVKQITICLKSTKMVMSSTSTRAPEKAGIRGRRRARKVSVSRVMYKHVKLLTLEYRKFIVGTKYPKRMSTGIAQIGRWRERLLMLSVLTA
jgi:hypothetical protein